MELQDRVIEFEGDKIKLETWTELDRSVHLTVEGFLELHATINKIMADHFRKNNKSITSIPIYPSVLSKNIDQPIKVDNGSSLPCNNIDLSIGFAPPPLPKTNTPKNTAWTAIQRDEMQRICTHLDIDVTDYKDLDAFINDMNDTEIKVHTDINGSNVDRVCEYLRKKVIHE